MNVVLGIDFGGTKVALATMGAEGGSPDGGVLHQTRVDTRGSATEVVRESMQAAHRLVSETTAQRGGQLTAVGVSTAGVVRDGQVRLAPNVPGWDGLELPRLLHEELGTARIRIDNDVKAATAAELRWGRLKGVDVGVYFNLGTGLAAGLVVDGRVVRGAHDGAGEIAYLLRRPGEPGYADGRAPLEEHVSGGALAGRGSALLGEPVTAADVFARRDDPRLEAVLVEALDALAMTVVNLCIILDPQRVVLGGGMMAAANQIVPGIRRAVRRAVPFPPEITAARFVDDAPLYGALALALAFDP
ncbi:MAG TPA: ROK family protein [Acidimicrobiales bacterium]